MRFRWHCVLVVVVVMAGSLLLAACGGEEEDGPTATPSPMPSPRPTPTATPAPTLTPASGERGQRELPPSALLRAGDARQTGALGTFTWKGFHGDAFAVVVPTEPIAVATGEPLVLELGFDPTKVYVAVWRPEQGAVIWEPSDHTFAWRVERSSEEPVVEETPPVARTLELRLDLPLGTYIVDVFAKAAAESASYGFHLEIVP